MSSQLNEIGRDFKSRYALNSLANSNVAILAVSPSAYRGVTTRSEFNDWQNNFEEGYKGLLDTFETQGNSVNESYLRDLDVEQGWKAKRFFAEHGKEGARETLGYYDLTEQGDDVFRKYSEEQWDTLTQSKSRPTTSYDDSSSTIEGHHINDVSTSSKLEAESWSSGPENIRFMSRQAHKHSEAFGHGGNVHNSTVGEANELDQAYENISGYNNSTNVNDIIKDGGETALIVAAAALIIQSGYSLYKYKNDDLTRGEIIKSVFKQGAATSALLGSSSMLYTAGYSTVVDSLHNSSPPNLSEESDSVQLLSSLFNEDVVIDLLGMGTGLSTVKIGINSYKNLQSNGLNKATLVAIGKNSLHVGVQEAAFFGAGMGVDMLATLLIPDPTGVTQSIIIVSRVGYGAWNYFAKNKEAKKLMEQLKNDLLYDHTKQSKRLSYKLKSQFGET